MKILIPKTKFLEYFKGRNIYPPRYTAPSERYKTSITISMYNANENVCNRFALSFRYYDEYNDPQDIEIYSNKPNTFLDRWGHSIELSELTSALYLIAIKLKKEMDLALEFIKNESSK